MQPPADGDFKKLLSDVIKKQIVILGPDITLAKARNVHGLTIDNDGTVSAISGDPQELTKQLVEQFMELSGLIVKKTMEPLLGSYAGIFAGQPQPQATTTVIPAPTPAVPAGPVTQPVAQPTPPQTVAQTQPAAGRPMAEAPVSPPAAPVQSQKAPIQPQPKADRPMADITQTPAHGN